MPQGLACSAASGRSVTAAPTSSPSTRLGSPNTAAWCTAGWLNSTASTSVAAGVQGWGGVDGYHPWRHPHDTWLTQQAEVHASSNCSRRPQAAPPHCRHSPRPRAACPSCDPRRGCTQRRWQWRGLQSCRQGRGALGWSEVGEGTRHSRRMLQCEGGQQGSLEPAVLGKSLGSRLRKAPVASKHGGPSHPHLAHLQPHYPVALQWAWCVRCSRIR